MIMRRTGVTRKKDTSMRTGTRSQLIMAVDEADCDGKAKAKVAEKATTKKKDIKETLHTVRSTGATMKATEPS